MAQYSIVKNNTVINTIEADEAYITENHNNDIVVLGSVPIGYAYENGSFRSPDVITPDVSDFVKTLGYTSPIITKITVRALKQRLTIAERHALRNTSDLYAADIYDDLLTSSYVDLELDDVAQGIGYILNLLTTVPNVQNEDVMTVVDANARLTELLASGTETEKYNGVL